MKIEPKLKGIQKLSALYILLISFIIGLAGYFGAMPFKMETLAHIMFGWDIFCLVLISLHWYMFFNTSTAETRLKAVKQDETRGEIFAIVLVSTFGGFLAADTTGFSAGSLIPIRMSAIFATLSTLLVAVVSMPIFYSLFVI